MAWWSWDHNEYGRKEGRKPAVKGSEPAIGGASMTPSAFASAPIKTVQLQSCLDSTAAPAPMFRIGKLTDYATVVMSLLASDSSQRSASELAQMARLEAPTVSKLLKSLAQAELVTSTRGVNGGYRLARAAEAISVADIIAAMEGPIGFTECAAHAGACDHEPHCSVRGNWRQISAVVERALRSVSLAEMAGRSPPGRARDKHIPLAMLAAD